MYYYIFEPIKNRLDRSFQERLKRTINTLGIAGETVTPTPARTVKELVEIGLMKGYSTIVGAGSDLFANKLITALLSFKQNDEQRVVFGYVPFDAAKSSLAKIIKVTNTQEACETLRYRKIEVKSVGLIYPKKYFISPINLISKKPIKIALTLLNIEVQSDATQITITPDITVSWTNNSLSPSPTKKLLYSLFDKEIKDNYFSKFSCHKIILQSSPSLPVYLENEIITHTPVEINKVENLLHLIIGRDIILANGKES